MGRTKKNYGVIKSYIIDEPISKKKFGRPIVIDTIPFSLKKKIYDAHMYDKKLNSEKYLCEKYDISRYIFKQIINEMELWKLESELTQS